MAILEKSPMLTGERNRLVSQIVHEASTIARLGHEVTAEWSDSLDRITRAGVRLADLGEREWGAGE